MKRYLTGIMMALLFAGPAHAVIEVQGHPLIKPYPGSRVWASRVVEFDQIALPMGKVSFDKESKGYVSASSVKLEGKITTIDYRTPAERSALEVLRNYEAGLQQGGFEILFSCLEKACGRGYLLKKYFGGGINAGSPGTGILTAKLSREEGDVHVLLGIDQRNTHNYLVVVESRPMETGLVKVDADALLNDIERTGHASIYGIYFDTDKADVKPESRQALGEISRLLQNRPQLKLYVVGHSDSIGRLDYNKGLSMRRATAVVDVLVRDYGIQAERLQPDGVGPLSPVLANSSEAGRAKNRRVELVAQ